MLQDYQDYLAKLVKNETTHKAIYPNYEQIKKAIFEVIEQYRITPNMAIEMLTNISRIYQAEHACAQHLQQKAALGVPDDISENAGSNLPQ